MTVKGYEVKEEMKRFLVGVNGERTPDPAYWRERNEVIIAEDEKDAKEVWKERHEGWYCGEPISTAIFPYTEDEKLYPNASNWKFSDDGCEEVKYFEA